MKIYTIRQAFRETQDYYGIQGKALAACAGISPQFLAKIRTGSSWPSEDVLMRILEAMDKLAPGSKLRFCLLLAGKEPKHLAPLTGDDCPKFSYEDMGDEDLAQAMIDMGKAWKRRQSRKTQILAS